MRISICSDLMWCANHYFMYYRLRLTAMSLVYSCSTWPQNIAVFWWFWSGGKSCRYCTKVLLMIILFHCILHFYILHFCGACTFTSIQSIQDEFNILSKINQNNMFYNFDNFSLFRAWLSRRRAEGVALENWPGENTDRALWRHPGHLQADPLGDKHPSAQLLPGRQGGRGQGLQGDMDWDKGNNTESWPKIK